MKRPTKGSSALRIGVLLASASLALAACGGSSSGGGGQSGGDPFSGDLKVQVYGDWPFVKQNAEAFMKAHPGAKIGRASCRERVSLTV